MLSRAMRTGFLGGMLALASHSIHAEPYNNPSYDTAGYGVVTLDERVAKLEKQLTGSTLLEMFNTMERLQAEVLRLGGQVEELNHALETLRKQQKDMYLDLDQRMQAGIRPAYSSGSPASTPGDSVDTDVPQKPAPDTLVTPAPKPATATASNESSGRQAAYQKAFNLLKDGKYPEATKELKAFITSYPSGEFSDNAYYWLGEAQYVNGDRTSARDTFREMIKKFPQSSKVADALLKIGYIEYDSAQYANAKELLNDVIKRYPASSAARMAEKRLEKIKTEKH